MTEQYYFRSLLFDYMYYMLIYEVDAPGRPGKTYTMLYGAVGNTTKELTGSCYCSPAMIYYSRNDAAMLQDWGLKRITEEEFHKAIPKG